MALLEVNAPLRRDEDFDEQNDKSHHRDTEETILKEINLGLISSFCLDYIFVLHWHHKKVAN